MTNTLENILNNMEKAAMLSDRREAALLRGYIEQLRALPRSALSLPWQMRAAHAIADDFTPGFCNDEMVEQFAKHIAAFAPPAPTIAPELREAVAYLDQYLCEPERKSERCWQTIRAFLREQGV